MNDKLKYIYDDIYRWLIFAEAKNTGFLAVVGFIIDFLLKEKEKLLLYFDFFFYIFFVWSLFILLILIGSFIPFLNQRQFISNYAYKSYKRLLSDNQIFYINIFLIDYGKPNNRTVEDLLGISNNAVITDFDSSLVTQIKETARVTTIKYTLFNFAIKNFFFMCFFYLINIVLCA